MSPESIYVSVSGLPRTQSKVDSPVAVLSHFLPPVFQEAARHPGVEGGASPHGYPFYLPMGSPPRGYSFPSSMFVSQNREKQVSPEPSLDGQLACRWMKVDTINAL